MQKLCIMPDQMARLSCKSQLSSLIFHHAVAFLLLTHSHGGQSQATGQPQPIVAMVGDDITLPCHVKPATDAVHQMLEWSRPDLNPRFVHLRRFGEDQLVDQNPSYKGRTSASIDRLKQGDMSLTLSKVKLSDEGTYRCFSPGLETDSSVQLVVVPVSVTTIEITKVSSGVLQCESEGWYEEPEVLWLYGEGNLLSAGPPETIRGPDDLYNVSSRVTVEKRHSNSFTCRVQQKNTNQTRETHIQVPDDFFTDSSGSNSSASTIIGLVVGILFILVVAFVVWKWRQNKTKTKKQNVDEETSGGEERKSNSINNDSEQESLIERETDGREKLTVETETMKNQVKMEEENSAECLSEETGCSCQIEEETHQEKGKKGEINNTPAEGETQPEETKSINTETSAPGPAERGSQPEQPEQPNTERAAEGQMDGNGQQQQVRTGGEANNDLINKEGDAKSISEETPAPGPADRETQPEQPNTERAAEDLMDGDGQQQQVRSEGKAKNDSDNRDDNAKSTSEETPAPGPTERETQPEQPKSVNIERAAEGQMDGDGKQQQQQVRTGGDANDDSDNRDEDAKPTSEESPAPGSADGETQPEQPNTERAAEGQMDGDGKQQQQQVRSEGKTKNDSDNRDDNAKRTSEETPAPGPADRETQPEQPNTERAAEGQMDGDGKQQQQQVRTGGDANDDSDNRDDNAKPTSEEIPAPGSAERGTQPEQPNTKRAADDLMDGDGKQQQQQVRSEGKTKNDSDNRDDNAKPTSEETPAPGPAERETQPKSVNIERAAEGQMDGDGKQQQFMTGEEAKNDNDKDSEEEEIKSPKNKAAGQDPTDEENNDLDQTGGQMGKSDPTPCPTEREGHTDNNRDRKDGVNNTTPLSPADGPSQKDEDEDTESINNEPADQGSNEGDTQRDELQAGAERNTEDKKNTKTERPSSPKTEQPTEEQLEKSPNSRDGEDGMTPRKGNTTSDQPPTAQAHRDVEKTEEETEKTEGETHGKQRINGQPEKHLNQADINDAATSRAACGKRRQKKK